jgi:hypothetical protein
MARKKHTRLYTKEEAELLRQLAKLLNRVGKAMPYRMNSVAYKISLNLRPLTEKEKAAIIALGDAGRKALSSVELRGAVNFLCRTPSFYYFPPHRLRTSGAVALVRLKRKGNCYRLTARGRAIYKELKAKQ